MTKRADTGRLIIVSNRLPVTVVRRDGGYRFTPSSGGLATALGGVHDETSLWVGHSGVFTKDDSAAEDLDARLDKQNLKSVSLKESEYQKYYLGMSNGVLWPLFHYFPQSMKLESRDWQAYKSVNESFAKEVLKHARPGDRIWVQDYQLMLLPQMLREAEPSLNIAYFHHVPFPSSEIFRVLPMRRELLHGLLGADLIGFHTYDYARHFISSANTILGKDVWVEEINHSGRIVKVGTFPIGIDSKSWVDISEKVASKDSAAKKEFGDKLLFVGIDRLDYTKGIPERLAAFKLFLKRNPEMIGKAVLVQVCVPSRTKVSSYNKLRKEVERMIGEIAGEFGRAGYMPVHYIYRGLPQEEIVQLYRIADMMLVTPLRDGLNLVAKEFVASSANPNAMLVLSEFAGAAAEMGEAVTVNPYDVDDLVGAMESTLRIPAEEKQERMAALRKRVLEHDCHDWAQEFLDHWDAAYKSHRRKPAINEEFRAELKRRVKEARHVYVFCDYDGTMVPIVSRPEKAVPTDAVHKLIKSMNVSDRFRFILVTGRSRDFCRQHVMDRHPKLDVAAEHGLYIYRDGDWIQRAGAEDLERVRSELMHILTMHTRNVPGSEIEIKESGIVWHYRNANQRFAQARVRMLQSELRSLLSDTSLTVSKGNKILEIKPTLANKGHAVEHILENYGYDESQDIVLTIGDDTTDEDMFQSILKNNFSICVGRALTHARTYLNDQSDVIPLLNDLMS